MFLTLLMLVSCKDDVVDTSAPEWSPDLVCPGATGCEDGAGTLHAQAAVADITPPCFESWTDVDGNGEYSKTKDEFLDCGCDRLCPDDEGYTSADEGEGDDEFAAVWMGGFSAAHPATGVADGIQARALVLDKGDVRIAIVSVDLIGFFYDDTRQTRELLAERGLEVDYLLVGATHTHEGPDTMGLWGERTGKSGYQPEYLAFVRERIADTVEEAVAGLTEVGEMRVGGLNPEDEHERGAANVIDDGRDPVVIVDELGVLYLADTSGDTIATVVNWGEHPETLADDNYLISSDFVHLVRETVEGGSTWDAYSTEGLGGTAIYLQGMVGGMMTPLHTTTHTPDGDVLSGATWEKNDAIGTLLGEMALKAVAEAAVTENTDLYVAHSIFTMPVDNIAFQAMFRIGVFPRELSGYDPDAPLDDDNVPDVETEMDHIRIGPLDMLTIPGELLPEVGIGGYDGSKTGSTLYDLVQAENPNPPDISAAPSGPYIRDQMSGEFNWIVGLGNDELGYIIPAYNFKLHESVPYLDEAEGDHYEETNSLGPDTEPIISAQAERLLQWSAAH
jgi:hypothetical protein